MKVTSREVAELKAVLTDLREKVSSLPLEAPVFTGGATVGQLSYHVGEAAAFWLRFWILGQMRARVRDEEFSGSHNAAQIDTSLAAALDACDAVAEASPEGDKSIFIPVAHADGQQSWTVGLALLHVPSHTAEHAGHITAAAEAHARGYAHA